MARGRRRRWVGGARGKYRDSRDRKAEIENEWAEWQTGLVEQQAYAKINPRPDKEDEDDHDYYDDDGRLRDPSCRVGATTQSDVSPPEWGAHIGPQPPHGPAAMAGSGLI